MLQFNANAVLSVRSTAFLFRTWTNYGRLSDGAKQETQAILTGNVPGKAASKGTIDVFGSDSQLVSASTDDTRETNRHVQRWATKNRGVEYGKCIHENSFRLVFNCVWISSPIIVSHPVRSILSIPLSTEA